MGRMITPGSGAVAPARVYILPTISRPSSVLNLRVWSPVITTSVASGGAVSVGKPVGTAVSVGVGLGRSVGGEVRVGSGVGVSVGRGVSVAVPVGEAVSEAVSSAPSAASGATRLNSASGNGMVPEPDGAGSGPQALNRMTAKRMNQLHFRLIGNCRGNPQIWGVK